MWRYISVLLLFLWQVVTLALRYGGDIQTVQTWAEQRGQIVKYAAIVSTWPFTPIILFTALLVVWIITEFGWPWKIQKHREAEQAVYDQTIAGYRDGDGLPLNCFYRAGGFKLTRQGILGVCRRLGKVNANPLPTVPKGQWVKFIRRAQTVGRPMETVEQATEAFDEWKKTKTLKPPWDFGEPSGDFETFEDFWKRPPPPAIPTPEIQTSPFSEPIELPRKFVVVNPPREVGPKVVPPRQQTPEERHEAWEEEQARLGISVHLPRAGEVLKRSFTRRTPSELLALYQGRTVLQGDKLMEPFKGLWIEAEATVAFLGPDNEGSVAGLRLPDGKMIDCRFGKRWHTEMARFNNDDRMKVRGRIAPHQNGQQLYLLECEPV